MMSVANNKVLPQDRFLYCAVRSLKANIISLSRRDNITAPQAQYNLIDL